MKQSIKCMLILLAALSLTACSPGRGEEETGLPDTGKTQEDAGNKREDSGDKETESGMKTEVLRLLFQSRGFQIQTVCHSGRSRGTG